MTTLAPYAGPDWEVVNLPHAARQEDDTSPSVTWFQGIVWYRKVFKPSPAWAGKRVALKFEAAMQRADIWVNGEHRLTHTGGYLPFEVDLTQDAATGRDLVVTLSLDNRDDKTFPPGRPQKSLDFTYAGGLYRNVWLEVTSPTYLQDVYAYSRGVSATGADVVVQARVSIPKPGQRLAVRLLDPRGREVGHAEGTAGDPQLTIHVDRPDLWDLDHPALYRVDTRLTEGTATVDEKVIRMGIRRFEFDHQRGFSINGHQVRLEGSNRHMGFPVVGNAASDAAQSREIKKLKAFGLNVLRLCHYPQSNAVLDACDELGMLVIDPIPGWQFFNDTPEFRDHVLQDVRETVARDRSHPSVAIFETCLNETYSAPDSFWIECHRVAHETFGGGNFFTGGDSYGKRDFSRPIWDVPWTGWDDASFTRPPFFKKQKGVDREYGDYEFGGEESSSRADRGAGEGASMLQAWNFIWSHNRNRGNAWSFGDLTWEAIDTYRGMNPTSPVSKSGLLDLFRLPKTIAYFYQSQGLTSPKVHIANQWSPRPSPTKVVVFSNCDSVALLLNGKEVARRGPDSGPTTGYVGPKIADPLYWAHGKGEIVPATNTNESIGGSPGALPFNGGNCKNLSHPPFTFDGVPYQPGKLEAVGYRDGKVAVRDVIYTPGKPTRLVLRVDTQGRALEADGSDFVFVYAELQGEHHQVVPDATGRVRLSVRGLGQALGATDRPAVSGIAAFMVRSEGQAGQIEIGAQVEGLPPARLVIWSH